MSDDVTLARGGVLDRGGNPRPSFGLIVHHTDGQREYAYDAKPRSSGNRSGLKPGAKAPEFTLHSVEGGEVSLADFAGRRTPLVFVQSGCGSCHDIVPELNRLQPSGQLQVVVINSA